MRLMLFLAAIAIATARGEQATAETMRQKVHAKIMAAFPLPRPAIPADEKPVTEEPAILMKPFVVESERDRNLDAAIARQTQKEPFSATKGGTLYGTTRAQLGGWWTPGQGWSFLKISW
jgi:hypothetical protein